MAEACNKAKSYRIVSAEEDDRDRRCRPLGGKGRGRAARDQHRCPSRNEIGGQGRQAIEFALGGTILDFEVASLDQTAFSETREQGCGGGIVKGSGAEKSDQGHRLAARRDRPCGRGTERR